MARRRAIEPEELFETADRLKAAGREVTATVLLDELGGGSLRTIYKLLGEWEQAHPFELTPVTNEIPADVMAGYTNSWRLVSQAAERSIKAVKDKADQEIEAALKKFQDALDYSGKLESENESQSLQIEDLKVKLVEWEAQTHAAQADAAGHKAAAEQLERVVEKQERDLDRLRVDSEGERDKHNEAQHQSATMIEQLRLEQEKAVREAAELRGQVEALKDQYAQLLAALGDSGKKKT
jgi:hypothetical protein